MSVPQDKIYNVYWEGPFEWKQIDTAQRASISLPKRLKKGKNSAVIKEWNSETNQRIVVGCILRRTTSVYRIQSSQNCR